MRYLLFLLALSSSAATIAVDVRGTTSTGAILHYIAPDAGACVFTASPASPNPLGLPEVLDLDNTLFPGSSSDLRTVNVQNGLERWTRIGQAKEATASDGNQYSLALATAQPYSWTLSCDSGANTASGQFTTKPIPLGDTMPRVPTYDANAWLGMGWPKVSWANPAYSSAPVIDPMTGAVLRRITGPGDSEGNDTQNICYPTVIDQASAWTNIGNLGCNPDMVYASLSGAGGTGQAIFLSSPFSGNYRPTYTYNTYNTPDDLKLLATMYGSDSSEQMSWCLSMDFGASCSGLTITATLPTSPTGVTINSTYPTAEFNAWGSAVTLDAISGNAFPGTLSGISGSTVTWGSNTGFGVGYNIYFPVTYLKPGDKIQISGGATQASPACPNNICTIASITDEKHIVLTESFSSWTPTAITTLNGNVTAGATSLTVTDASGLVSQSTINISPYSGTTSWQFTISSNSIYCTALSGNTFSSCNSLPALSTGANVGQNLYAFPNYGVKLWKSGGTGTVYLDSVKGTTVTSNSFNTGAQGSAASYCGTSLAQVDYGPTGSPLSTPEYGYQCIFADNSGNNYLYLFIPATGEARRISGLPGLTSGGFYNSTTFWAFNSGTGKIGQCAYDPIGGEWQPETPYTYTLSSHITCTYTLSNSVPTEIAAAYPGIKQSYFAFQGLQSVSCPGGTGVSGCDLIFMLRNTQGAPAWFCTVDVSIAPGTGQVTLCRNNFDTYPVRWNETHGNIYYSTAGYEFWGSMGTLNLGSGTPGGGPWTMYIGSITGAGGPAPALSSSYYDPRTCQAIWTAEGQSGSIPSWLVSQGATGNNCIEANVASQPIETSPNAADTGTLGGYSDGSFPIGWVHNSALCNGDGSTADCFAQWQTLQPGDDISDSNQLGSISNGEQFVVVNTEEVGTSPTETWNVLLIRKVQTTTCGTTTTAFTHTAGWKMTASPPGFCGESVYWVQKGLGPANAILDNAAVFGAHSGSMGYGSNGILNYEGTGWTFPAALGGLSYGARNILVPSQLGTGLQYGLSSAAPSHGNSTGISVASGNIQTHNGEGCTSSMCTQGVAPDGHPIGGAGGQQIPQWSQSATLVSGQTNTYLIGAANNSGTPLYTSPVTTADLKEREILAFAGAHYLYDISGPGSVISDSTPWAWCEVLTAGECVSGSTGGQVYEVVPGANIAGTCQDDQTILTPCWIFGPNSMAQLTTFEVDKSDPFGQFQRNMTMALTGPNRTSNYQNMHGMSTGEWNFTPAFWTNGIRGSDLWAVLNPPWQPDSRTRSYFGGPTVPIAGGAGVTARVEFGYNTNLYCTSRAEVCTTATSNSDPYAFASETQAWTTCTSGCQITIPAIANRVLYYQVQTQVGGVTTTQPMQIVVN